MIHVMINDIIDVIFTLFNKLFQVGISPTGAANLRNTSLRNLSAEEKKFANTVVATSSGRDVVMLGAAGRQKRERKMPSRYICQLNIDQDNSI